MAKRGHAEVLLQLFVGEALPERRAVDVLAQERTPVLAQSDLQLEPVRHLGRRPALDAAGITINGLPVFNDRPNPEGAGIAVDLDSYYELKVIGGASSFSMIAHSDVFAPTILRKLVREIAGDWPSEDPQFAEAGPLGAQN